MPFLAFWQRYVAIRNQRPAFPVGTLFCGGIASISFLRTRAVQFRFLVGALDLVSAMAGLLACCIFVFFCSVARVRWFNEATVLRLSDENTLLAPPFFPFTFSTSPDVVDARNSTSAGTATIEIPGARHPRRNEGLVAGASNPVA